MTDDVNGDSDNENNGHHGDVNESSEVKLQFKIDLIQCKMISQYTSRLSDTIHIHLLWMRDRYVSFVNPREFPVFGGCFEVGT